MKNTFKPALTEERRQEIEATKDRLRKLGEQLENDFGNQPPAICARDSKRFEVSS